MALVWLNGFVTETVTGRSAFQVPLTSVSSNERLRRTIVKWRLDMSEPTSAQADAVLKYGILSLIEWTEGDPPPTPPIVTSGGFESRDILYSDLAFPGPAVVLVGRFGIPGDGLVGTVDTPVQRDPSPNAGIVWWNWGLGPPGVPGVGVLYHRVWWNILVETVA